MRVRASENLSVEHPRDLNIVGEFGRSCDALRAVNSGLGRPHDRKFLVAAPGWDVFAFDHNIFFKEAPLELDLGLDDACHISFWPLGARRPEEPPGGH